MSEADGESKTGPTTKERLATVAASFDSFDKDMRIGTRQRREKDEFRIAELKKEMQRLDGDLVAEIKRRKEMNKSTQVWFEEQLVNLDTNFHASLKERSEATHAKLETLDGRITELDKRFEEEKLEILRQIDLRGQELAKLLEDFKEEFEHDRKLRLQREEKLIIQLSDQEQQVLEKFDDQIETREARYNAIRKILEENVKLRDKAEERFQSFFEKEIHTLHNQVREEVEVREREDDEIVEALNRYTRKLQESLKIINATDM
jgi:hypothetical protein